MTRDELITEVMDGFDFERVHACMVLLNWKWYDMKGMKLPSVVILKATALSLLGEVYDKGITTASTGGLYASFSEGILSLTFAIEENFAEAE